MLTRDQIAHALERKAGNITEAARVLKVARQTLHRRIAEDETLQQVLTDAREALVDVAESQLLKQIKKGNTAAIIFTLKTQGKSRGYVERSEISGANGGPIVGALTTLAEWNQAQDEARQQAAQALKAFDDDAQD